MTLPVYPNNISLSQIQTEFGGSNPISLSEYYSNDTYVATGFPGIPASGTIRMSNFHGKGITTTTNINIFGGNYIDFTLPIEKVWVKINMIGGGGGGANGDGAIPGAVGGSGGYLYWLGRLPATVGYKTLRIIRGFGGLAGNYGSGAWAGFGGVGYAFTSNVLADGSGGRGGQSGTAGGSGAGAGGGGMGCALYWDQNDGIQIPIAATAGGGGAGGAGQNGGERRGNPGNGGLQNTSTPSSQTGLMGGGNQNFGGYDHGAGGGGGGGMAVGGTIPTAIDKNGTLYPIHEGSGSGGQQGAWQYNPALVVNSVTYGWGAPYIQSWIGSTTNSGAGGAVAVKGNDGQCSVSWVNSVPNPGTAFLTLT